MSTDRSPLDYDAEDTRPKLGYAGPQDPRVHPYAPGLCALKAGLAAARDEADFALQQRAEEECLRSHADGGWRVDPQNFALTFGTTPDVGGGNEHAVFLDGDSGRVVKLTTHPPSYGAQGTALDYLTNLENSNLLFGDGLRFEGLLTTDAGIVIVTSQPFVIGEPAAEELIVEFFAGLGFASIGYHSFERADADNGRVIVRDARPDNVFRAANTGLLMPIDVQIFVR